MNSLFTYYKNNKSELFYFIFLVPLWINSSSISLRTTDGIVYAQIAKEMYLKNIFEWVSLTWPMGQFYDHPHFLMWMNAISFKILGVSTFSAVLPTLILSSLIILVYFKMTHEFLGEKSGIIFLTMIFFDHLFIKYGRGPMLEVPLMLFLSLSLYFILRYVKKEGKVKNALYSGLSITGAIMSKGIVGIMPLGVCFIFIMIVSTGSLRDKVNLYLKWLTVVLAVIITILGLIDLWHFLVVGNSFWKTHFNKQIIYSINGRQTGGFFPIFFYIKRYYERFIPFSFLATFSMIYFFIKIEKFKEHRDFVILGLIYLFGMFFGFSISKHSAPWYINIHFMGTWLIVGGVAAHLLAEKINLNKYKNYFIKIILFLLVISSFFPALFYKDRMAENFFKHSSKYEILTKNKRVADCVTFDTWKAPFFISFYLGAKRVECNEMANFKVINSKQMDSENGEVLYSYDQLHLVRN
ncbi:MAG: glycosyltransferase family 39 protein [Halobacteriovoraceae bacterium]|nr:glycosyltransferase family 39 protein [Halobacteriovoraceae bacterium]